jgi:hypothetical protein
MIYHHPYRPPVNEDKVILTDKVRHSIPAEEIHNFIFGQAERLTAIYTEREQVARLNTKKYNPFHVE